MRPITPRYVNSTSLLVHVDTSSGPRLRPNTPAKPGSAPTLPSTPSTRMFSLTATKATSTLAKASLFILTLVLAVTASARCKHDS